MASNAKEIQNQRTQTIQTTLESIKALKTRQQNGDGATGLTSEEQHLLSTEAALVEELRQIGTNKCPPAAAKESTFTVAVQQDRTNVMRFTCTTSDTFGDLKEKIVSIILSSMYRMCVCVCVCVCVCECVRACVRACVRIYITN